MKTPNVVVFDDVAALAVGAARYVAERANADEKGIHIVLAGGTTPCHAYEKLAMLPVRWDDHHLWFGDERCVPPDDPGSNYRMAHDALIGRIAIPEQNVHRIRGELDPHEGATAAEAELDAHFPAPGLPSIDLVLLGIGADGHTASLFPKGEETENTERRCLAVYRPGLPQRWRITMTLPVLNASREVVFLAAGTDKAEATRRAIDGDPELPAGCVRPNGPLTWLITRDLADAAGIAPSSM